MVLVHVNDFFKKFLKNFVEDFKDQCLFNIM